MLYISITNISWDSKERDCVEITGNLCDENERVILVNNRHALEFKWNMPCSPNMKCGDILIFDLLVENHNMRIMGETDNSIPFPLYIW